VVLAPQPPAWLPPGWAVAVNYQQRRDAADALVHEIQCAGGEAMAVQGDVGDEAR
jgi:hypothetical protein